MTTLFETKYEDKILGKLTTVDRVIFNGYLTSFYLPGFFKRFLSRQGVLLKDFSRYIIKPQHLRHPRECCGLHALTAES